MNEIVLATAEHALALAPRLRKGDIAEIKASSGGNPEDILLLSLGMSPKSWAWLHNGRVMAIFGVAAYPARPGVGIPWLLAAKGIERHKVYVMRQSRKYMQEVLKDFPVLENWVDCRNTRAIQWLSWCGAALCEVDPFRGVQRLPFIRFNFARTPPSVSP